MREVLIVHGGWDGHQPRESAGHAADLLRSAGFSVEVAADLAVFDDAARLRRLALIVPVWTMGELSEARTGNIDAAVRAGTGLAGWHGGMCDAFRTNTQWQFMTGGQWVAHPGNRIPHRYEIADRCHPVTAGVGDFALTSEQYYMHIDPAATVLATTTFSGEHGDVPWIRGVRMPAAWTKPWGSGRVFYTSVGHALDDLRQPDAARLLIQGLCWAAATSA